MWRHWHDWLWIPPHLNHTDLTTPDPIPLQKNLYDLKTEGAQMVAMEVSSHSLVQHRVCGVQFKIGVFTQLSRDHLDYHGDMESYARAKEMLFQFPSLEYGVINLDDELGQRLIEKYQQKMTIFTYSALGNTHKNLPSIHATRIDHSNKGFAIEVNTPWGSGELSTRLLGRFNISNLLAVLAVLGILKMPLQSILKSLASLETNFRTPATFWRRRRALGGGRLLSYSQCFRKRFNCATRTLSGKIEMRLWLRR